MIIYCLIPARRGSKRIKNKNLILLNGKPLITISVESALRTKLINKTFVSTNDEKIIKKVNKKAFIIKRPNNISKDNSTTEQTVSHFINYLKKNKIILPDLIVLLQCTSPFREKKDIHLSIQHLIRNKLDSLFSGCTNKNLFWIINKKKLQPINYDPKKRLREQKMKDQFIENGSIFVFKTKGFIKNKCRIFGKVGVYIMKRENSFQIDDPQDIDFIKKIKR